MYIGPRVMYPLYFSYFNETNFLDKFSKNTQISNFMKIRLVRNKLFYADTRTDITNPIVAFHNSANTPKTENALYVM